MQVSFRFHSQKSLRYLYLRVSIQRFEPSGVHSLKELWERNGNSHSHNSDTITGTGMEAGIFVDFFFLENC